MRSSIVLLVALLGMKTYAACPKGFIEVPANKDLGIAKPFCVMKYSAKAQAGTSGKIELLGCGDLECKKNNWAALYHSKNNPAGYKAVSVPEGVPWRSIDFQMAKQACVNLGSGFGLINNNEWITIANNILDVDANWSGNKVGVGFLNRGHSDRDPDQPCDSMNENVQGSCSNKGQDFHQKRTHTLSNGQTIWDMAGNLWEWVDWKVRFGRGASPADAWVDYSRMRPKIETGLDLDPKLFRSLKHPNFTGKQNIGKYWSAASKGESVAIRGGRWSHNQDSGIYSLDLSTDPKVNGKTITFRCVKR